MQSHEEKEVGHEAMVAAYPADNTISASIALAPSSEK